MGEEKLYKNIGRNPWQKMFEHSPKVLLDNLPPCSTINSPAHIHKESEHAKASQGHYLGSDPDRISVLQVFDSYTNPNAGHGNGAAGSDRIACRNRCS